jgi:hypothetical protein
VILEARVKSRHPAGHEFIAAELIDQDSFLIAGSAASRLPDVIRLPVGIE